MGLNANNAPRTTKQQPIIDPGTLPGRLVQVIDLGLQKQVYQGEEKPPKQEILTTYELSDEFMKDEEGKDIPDKPRWLSETFTLNPLSSDKAKSTSRYYALDPEGKFGGNWAKALSNPVMITVIKQAGKGKNKGKEYNNIASTSTMRAKDAEKLPPLVNDQKFFDMDEPDVELFLTLPQFIQDKIKGGLEYEGSKLYNLLQNHNGKPVEKKEEPVDDEIPSFDGDNQDDGNW